MKKLALTMGDPAGVGPELIEKILQNDPQWRDEICVIATKPLAQRFEGEYGVDCEITPAGSGAEFGEPTIEGAGAALQAMEIAAQGCLEDRFSGVVTGPISKHWCQLAGMKHPGQTEFFAEQWDGVPTMAFVTPRMRVALATWHIPLMEVKAALTEQTLRRCLDHTAELMIRLGNHQPRIAVCGLNPHAGEEGQIGMEEIELIHPVLDLWRKEYPGVELSDCLPADTVFFRHLDGEFDAVVSLYHDQALGPVKTVAFHEAVNVTLGLKHIRTSPDHGTAFGIAGQGIAKPDSMLSALMLAKQLR